MVEYGDDGGSCDPFDVDLEHRVFKKDCACQEFKGKCLSFCMKCYKELPKHLSTDLWFPFSLGFKLVYHDCLIWLQENSPRYANII